MINSIQHFYSEGVKKLDEIMMNYSTDVTKTVTELGRSMIEEEWESYDELLRKRKSLSPGWYIVRRNETTLLTSLGSVTYHKTLFKNKHTETYEYLLDRVMGIEKHARMTEDAEAKILEEAVQTSYRRSGGNAAITEDVVSKETVMNKIHSPRFPGVEPQPGRKTLKYLYIDADEDYVSLQYINEKGDIRKPRANTVMPKLIYVYEGITNENGRNELINKNILEGYMRGQKRSRDCGAK